MSGARPWQAALERHERFIGRARLLRCGGCLGGNDEYPLHHTERTKRDCQPNSPTDGPADRQLPWRSASSSPRVTLVSSSWCSYAGWVRASTTGPAANAATWVGVRAKLT